MMKKKMSGARVFEFLPGALRQQVALLLSEKAFCAFIAGSLTLGGAIALKEVRATSVEVTSKRSARSPVRAPLPDALSSATPHTHRAFPALVTTSPRPVRLVCTIFPDALSFATPHTHRAFPALVTTSPRPVRLVCTLVHDVPSQSKRRTPKKKRSRRGDAGFQRKIRLLLKICVPSLYCKEAALLGAHFSFLVLRTLLTIRAQRLNAGYLTSAIARASFRTWAKWIAHFAVWMGIGTVTLG